MIYWEDITFTFPVEDEIYMQMYITCINFRITKKKRSLKEDDIYYLHFYNEPLMLI
jgi:hypothetical protein